MSKKHAVRYKVTNRILQEMFENFNRGFFNSVINIPKKNVQFGTNRKLENGYGFTNRETNEIFINEEIQFIKSFVTIVLLHEMAHLALYQNGYVGYELHAGHHARFYAELDRLYKAGAYEGLL